MWTHAEARTQRTQSGAPAYLREHPVPKPLHASHPRGRRLGLPGHDHPGPQGEALQTPPHQLSGQEALPILPRRNHSVLFSLSPVPAQSCSRSHQSGRCPPPPTTSFLLLRSKHVYNKPFFPYVRRLFSAFVEQEVRP